MIHRHTVIYPLVAAMSLFVNILIHPIGPQAVADMESLALASRIIDKMQGQTVSNGEAKYVGQADALIRELLTLANGAVSRADRVEAADG